jgi:hypothetical protein
MSALPSAPHDHPHRRPLAPFERAVQRRLGTDMRLLYGMGAPILGMCVVIAVALGFGASVLTVAGLLVLEAIVLGVVLVGFVGVLNDDEDER